MPKDTRERPHFLRPLKAVLDRVFCPAPMHVCLEASHPTTLGRSSDLIMRIVRNECFEEHDLTGDSAIQTHFISDRLSVPPLDGHIVVIGGPRSNVIARIAMEYEATLGSKSLHYARHTNHTFKMEYSHIDRDDYGDRLYADMDSLDEDAREIIHYYYSRLRELAPENQGDPNGSPVNLFSKNRYLRWRNDRKLPSLSARINGGLETKGGAVAPQYDYTIYDHYIETVLPNILSENWRKHGLIVYHGLRALGTYVALQRLNDENGFLKGLEKRLASLKGLSGVDGKHPSAMQTGWQVIRALEPRIGLEDNLLDRLIAGRGYEDLKNPFRGERIIHRRHQIKKAVPEAHVELLEQGEIEEFRLNSFQEIMQSVGHKEDGAKAKRKAPNTVKLDEINEQQILDAMSLQRDHLFRRHDIYVLGCFEGKKTVYTQQSRALTLIHALYKAGKIRPNTKIGIVGGGVSGMAAAIAAVEAGARVVLMEKTLKLAPIQQYCQHRSLNPFSYDWPLWGSERDETDFPIPSLNWRTSTSAQTVFRKLAREFIKYVRQANKAQDKQVLTFYPGFKVRGYFFDRVNRKHILSKEKFPNDTQDLRKKPKRGANDDDGAWAEKQRDWYQALAAHNANIVRSARVAGTNRISSEEAETHRTSRVDCDIVIFATGYGAEQPDRWIKRSNLPALTNIVKNKSYWIDDGSAFKDCNKQNCTFIVSGSGDGALIDILRLCIKQFEEHTWHEKFVKKMNKLTQSDMSGAIWSNRREILVFAHALRELFESDEFRLIEGETDRISQIEKTLAGFDIDAFLDAMAIELNDVTVQNVSLEPQPFWAESAVSHRLLVWCLYKKGKVRFIRGSIVEADGNTVKIKRHLLSKERTFEVEGVIIRHGVGDQNSKFLDIPGLLYDYNKDPKDIARDGQRLVSLLRLSNDLHPETEKFFRHTLRNLL